MHRVAAAGGTKTGIVVERFSKADIREAGKLICSRTDQVTDELIEAFRVAHAWREAHIVPMRRVRSELMKAGRSRTCYALTAGRLKRFQSIRRKLQRMPLSLYQMQDIAGCRVIVGNMTDVDRLTDFYLGRRTKHETLGHSLYIDSPKPGGYRCNHVMLKFLGPDDITGGNRLTVEVQIRTALQHAWATAVEAVGLVLNEDLKSGRGSPDWLRLFALMSSEFAVEEARPPVPGVPDCEVERRAELRELERSLGAWRKLIGFTRALRQAQDIRGLSGHSYLIDFDSETMTVNVRSFSSFALTSEQYFNVELTGQLARDPAARGRNTVLVEVDAVSDLCVAYPNYFMDVRLFADRLVDYTQANRVVTPDGAKVQKARWDLSWWKNR
jgi:ppGpp synthetase/RelA/SpoT-type nucleotidyltranferase